MKPETRMYRYAKARSLTDKWGLLSKARKRYARHLVEAYAYPVRIALMSAYVFGYDEFVFDYRSGKGIRETVPARKFGFR